MMAPGGCRLLLRAALALVLAGAMGLAAQAESSWSVTYGGPDPDRFYRILPSPDGGFLVLGSFVTASSGWDGLLVKMGPTGVVVWAQAYGGPSDDFLYRMAPSADGGYFLAGATASFGAGGDDVWLIKVDAAGTPLWQRAYGQAGDQDTEGVAATPDGGAIVVADATLPGQGGDFWVFRVDATGDLRWSETLGGTADDYPSGVLATPGGGYGIVGSTYSFGPVAQVWVIHLDEGGGVTSQGAFGAGTTEMFGQDATLSTDGGAFFLGSTYGPPGGGTQALLVKLGASGNLLWQISVGGADTDEAFRVIALPGGECVFAGHTYGVPGAGTEAYGWAVRVDAGGSVVWQMSYGNASYDVIEDALPLSDGGILLAGTKAYDGPDQGQGWLIKVKGLDGTMDAACTFAAPTTFPSGSVTGFPAATTVAAVPYPAQAVSTAAAVSPAAPPSTVLCASALNCALEASALVPAHCGVGVPTDFRATVAVTDCIALPTFAWDFGDGTTSSLQNPTHSYAAAGIFQWTLTASTGGRSVTQSGSVTAVPPPVVSSMKKVAPPFTIVALGSNFQSGIQVFIDGTPWPSVLYKNSGKIKLTGGSSLKAAVPRGATRTFRFVNPDGGETTQTWSW